MNQPTQFSAARMLSCLALLAVVLAWSCDSYDPDMTPRDEVSVGQTQFYALPNSSTVIDLKTLVKSSAKVDLLIGRQPQQGTLTRLGAGLYAYMPQADVTSGRDYFMLDVRRDGQTVQVDTIYIKIGQDTTQLPCGVYAVMDVVSVPNTAAGQVIPINVLANDRICGADTSDLVVSIYTQPKHGSASTNGRTVSYTTSGYAGKDSFRYSVTSLADSSVHAFGMVRIGIGDSSCLAVRRDELTVNADTMRSNTIRVSVIANDDICDQATDIPTIVTPSHRGTATFISYGTISYTLSATPTADFTDSLTYRICHGSLCQTAVVRIHFRETGCTVTARPDEADLAAGSANPVTVVVLDNDTSCGPVIALSILQAPKTGSAILQDNTIIYQPNSGISPSDSIKYLLRDTSGGASETWVRINRQ